MCGESYDLNCVFWIRTTYGNVKALLMPLVCLTYHRYTLATTSTVAETGDKQSATKSTVADTVDFVAGFGHKSATTGIRQFVAVDFVADTVDFVATSVYRALVYKKKSSDNRLAMAVVSS